MLVTAQLAGLDRLIAEGRVRPADGDVLDLGDPLPLPEGAESPSAVLMRLRDE